MIKHRINYDVYGDDYTWYVRQDGAGDGKEYVWEPCAIRLREHERGTPLDPFIRLTIESAQQIMNSLWESGLRPRDGSGALAHVDAMKYHLEDMRRLVFQGENS